MHISEILLLLVKHKKNGLLVFFLPQNWQVFSPQVSSFLQIREITFLGVTGQHYHLEEKAEKGHHLP